MMGDKINIMFWDFPKDGNVWGVTVHPDGIVEIKFSDPITHLKGSFAFPHDADTDFVKGILNRLGFKPKQSND